MNLVLFGYQNLSNIKCGVEKANNLRGNAGSIQRISNARTAGSTVVDKKVNEKSILFNGVLRATDTISLEDIIKEYSLALSEEDRYLRISPNWSAFLPLADESGFEKIGDTTTFSFDSEVFQYGGGSIKFDADVSVAAGYAGIYTNAGTVTDISSYGEDGAFEAWVYLPQTAGVTGITLRVGNDSSNYYSGTATTQYDDTILKAGWNYISLAIADCTMTGTVDPYDFGAYVYLTVNYGGTMVDRSDFRLGGVIFQEESRSRNYKAYIESLGISSEHYDISRAEFSMSALAYEGVAESTAEYNVLGLTNQTTATISGTLDFDGSYTPLPVISMKLNAATNVSSITFTNTTTGDSVAVARTYVAGDRIVVDTKERSVTANGAVIDYDDVLPRFSLGENTLQISIATTGLESLSYTTVDSNLTGEI